MREEIVESPLTLRRKIRAGRFTGLTTGQAPGFVQCNLAIVPAADAADFVSFCRANAAACPVLAVGAPGDPRLPDLGLDLDVRTDLPGYWVYQSGRKDRVSDIRPLWRPDHVAVAIGCWFSMEDALLRAGVRLRHLELGLQGPLFRTARSTHAVGRFGGPLVVSMRPIPADLVGVTVSVTARYPAVHGAPVHVGSPADLGIADLSRPDFGEPVDCGDGDVRVFWACGVTPLVALASARPSFAITHAPGHMFITDVRDEAYAV